MFTSLAVGSMHLPDGFLSVLLSVLLWIVSAGIIAAALRRVNGDLGERQVPLMGLVAAAIFAGQMLNFAVAGGTSGHLMGAALATILLGPWAAIVVMACVVGVQALLFQDGGLLALGANIFNMGIVGVSVAHLIYQGFQRLSGGRRWGVLAGGFTAGWASILLAALAVALQLALSGTTAANLAIPAMGGIHAIIGLGEGLITLGALSFLYAARRDLFSQAQPARPSTRPVWLGGLALVVLLVTAAPLASSHPDGLEWVAEQQGFLPMAQDSSFQILPDYVFPGISDPAMATIAAGLIGALIVLAAVWGLAVSRRRMES